MANDEVRIVGLQRAEFAKAARLQTGVVRIQFIIAVFAAIAVLVTDPTWTYIAAGITAAFAIGWAWLSWAYRESRFQAERARRATLLLNGLGEAISANELRDLEARFTVSARDAARLQDSKYYSADEKPGFKRLAKILEESAFWSSHLLRHSSNSAWRSFVLYFLAGLALLLVSVPFVDIQQLQLGVRVFCALLMLLVSAEILGVAIAYGSAAKIVNNILPRLEAVAALDFPRADLLMILADYNSAVESAPMFRPGVYEKHRARLNELWSAKRPTNRI